MPEPAPATRPEPPAGQPDRRGLARETWFVQLAFLLPSVTVAVDMFASHLDGGAGVDPFPTLLRGHPLENLILGALSYLTVGAVVPLALLLLARTGNGPRALGMGASGWRRDLLPGAGIAVAGLATTYVLAGALGALLARSGLVNPVTNGPVPTYYLLYGLLASAVTAVTEETLVNGYLLTRLDQLGWKPSRALALSLCLRTSYHVYYGLGFVFTVPFGYYATRSFQKHRRLNRPILGHFLYDASVYAVSVLVLRAR